MTTASGGATVRWSDQVTESATPHAQAQGKLNEGPRLRHPRMLPRYNASVQARFAVAIGVVLGLLLGLGGYTFIYARGGSYLTNDPKACANCHVMREQFEGWQRSSHRASPSATTATRRTTSIGKYVTKGINGFWHSFYFTTGTFTSRSASRRATPGSPRAPAAPVTPTSSTPSTRPRDRARRSAA